MPSPDHLEWPPFPIKPHLCAFPLLPRRERKQEHRGRDLQEEGSWSWRGRGKGRRLRVSGHPAKLRRSPNKTLFPSVRSHQSSDRGIPSRDIPAVNDLDAARTPGVGWFVSFAPRCVLCLRLCASSGILPAGQLRTYRGLSRGPQPPQGGTVLLALLSRQPENSPNHPAVPGALISASS